jgi:ribosomal-protein-alanine N-acetyltransferase
MLSDRTFNTDRLTVSSWRSLGLEEHEAAEAILSHVSEDARQFLPDSLASIRSHEDAAAWLTQQQAEGTDVLFAKLQSSSEVAALLIASEQSDSGSTYLFIGYLVEPSHRGGGLATELVQGFVQWVSSSTDVDSLVAGVESSHAASRAVLSKSGFVEIEGDDSSTNYLKYEYRLNR